MKVHITRIDASLPLPEYHTEGSVAFDIYTREDDILEAGECKKIASNLIIETPPGFALIVAARSSLSKRGLQLSNGIGVIDQDYSGPEDEIHITLRNFTDAPVEIKRGERLAQGLFMKIEKAEWTEGEPKKNKSRGGFGSTGK